MDIREKKVLVFGSGISGESACRLLLGEGAEVVLYDGNDRLDRKEILEKISPAEGQHVEILLGELTEQQLEGLLDELSLVVMSPGVPTDLPIVERMR